MVLASLENLTVFPPFDSHAKETQESRSKRDSGLELVFDDLDSGAMANGTTSPYIKSEPSDYGFDPHQFMQYNQSHQQGKHFNTPGNMNVNPANLSNGMPQNYGQSNMSSSFNMGNSGIADDELVDLNIDQTQNGGFDFGQGMQSFLGQQQLGQQNSAMFSHTPEGAPMQSPFTHDFNYSQFRPVTGQQQQFAGAHSMPQQAAFRPHVKHQASDSRSPATPNTPGINNLQLGEDATHPGMQQIHIHRQSRSIGGNGWESTPSGHSWNDSSPLPSPASGYPMHPQISEVLTSTNSAHHHKVGSSLPTKMEGGGHPAAYQSQEAKRRRRRESHNQVERRRRDNINERIHDLGGLVPQHRLEDEKVRKHLQTNAPLSPSITNASGMSPPNAATALLAGPQGRRSTNGSITQGLPMEDKDKGPNKGDILNGSVAWTRDLMWYMHMKLRQEQELKDLVSQLGGAWPFEQSDEEKRMHSEICEVLNRRAQLGGFTGYSRAAGSGMRVPGYTNVAGDSLGGDNQPTGTIFPNNGQALSPGFRPGGSGMSSGDASQPGHPQFWTGEFKEEDEYGMEMQ